MGVSTIGLLWVDSVLGTALLLFGLGVGWNLSFVAATAQLADLTGASERGKLIGFNDLLSALLGASLALLGGYALDSLGVAALAIGATVIVAAPVLWLAPRRTRADDRCPEYSVGRLPAPVFPGDLMSVASRAPGAHADPPLEARPRRRAGRARVVLFGLAAHGRQGHRRLLGAGHRDAAGDRPLQGPQPRVRGRRLDARLQRRAGQGERPRPEGGGRGARWRRSRSSTGVAEVGDPFAEGGALSPDGRLASVDVRYTTDPSEIEKEDGEALLDAGEPGRERPASSTPRAAC